jgi:putative transposase
MLPIARSSFDEQASEMVKRHTHRQNYNTAGHAHELTFCCFKRYAFLQADRTCLWLCESINRTRIELEFDLWSYVFMPDHAHLIVYPRRSDYDISRIRGAIKHPMSKVTLAWLREHRSDWIPCLTRRRGKRTETLFWQSGGGYDRNIESSRALLEMIDYLHMNPVRKGFVQSAAEWRWSSANQFLERYDSPLIVDRIPSSWLDAT